MTMMSSSSGSSSSSGPADSTGEEGERELSPEEQASQWRDYVTHNLDAGNWVDLWGAIEAKDVLKVFPIGMGPYNSGTALWVRAGGPRSIESILRCAENRPRKGSHRRAGQLMCVAIVAMHTGHERPRTTGMSQLISRLDSMMADFTRCVFSFEKRHKVVVVKEEIAGDFDVPEACMTDRFLMWASKPWPTAEVSQRLQARKDPKPP